MIGMVREREKNHSRYESVKHAEWLGVASFITVDDTMPSRYWDAVCGAGES